MSSSISLWKPRRELSSDDACTTIFQYTLPPKYTPGPYASSSEEQSPSNTYVPSLKTLCLRKLLGYPEQVFTLGVARVHYEAPRSPSDYDLIRSLIPSYSQGDLLDPSFLEEVDPRLWALIVQILSPIPQAFKVYTLALSDVHLPLLQQIPPTKDFCLITVVTLRGSEHVDDDTIRHLGELHGLCVLDIACTAITSLGIRSLAKTLQPPSTYAERRGPWRLRILDLRDCRLDGAVVEYLAAFPLLSVVDLSGNRACNVDAMHPAGFRCCDNDAFFAPVPLLRRLEGLSSLLASQGQALFSHSDPFFLYVNRTSYTAPSASSHRRVLARKPVHRQPDVVTFPPPNSEGSQEPSNFSAVQAAVQQEAEAEASRRATAAFYTPLSSSKNAAAHDKHRRDRLAPYNQPTPSGSRGKSIRLFRPPRPWSMLESTSLGHIRASVVRPMKRPKVQDGGLQGDGARRSVQAKAAVQALHSMLGTRTGTSADDCAARGRNKILGPMQLSKNPFLRKSEGHPSPMAFIDSGLKGPLLNAHGRRSKPIEIQIPSPEANPDERLHDSGDDCFEEDDLLSKSTFTLPPPTTKPLQPISTLSVPPISSDLLPPPLMKPRTSIHRDPKLARRRSSGSRVQTTLSFTKSDSSSGRQLTLAKGGFVRSGKARV